MNLLATRIEYVLPIYVCALSSYYASWNLRYYADVKENEKKKQR